MKTIIVLLGVISILTLSNCKRYDDIVLTIQVLNYADSLGVSNVSVLVYKKKYPVISTYPASSKHVDRYSSITDKNGICKIAIDNYNRKKYWYEVEVNPNLELVNGGVFSHVSTIIEENELDEILQVWGSIIP